MSLISIQRDCVVVDSFRVSDEVLYRFLPNHGYTVFVRYIELKHPHFIPEFQKYHDKELIHKMGGSSIKIASTQSIETIFSKFIKAGRTIVDAWKELKVGFAIVYHVCRMCEPEFLDYRTSWWWELDGIDDTPKGYKLCESVYAEMGEIFSRGVRDGWERLEIVNQSGSVWNRFESILSDRIYKPIGKSCFFL